MLKENMKILLTLFILFCSSSVVADDISDFQIEGISVGDSLLKYMSEYEITKEIESNKNMYKDLSKKFSEVFLFKKFENYLYLSFLVKPNDLNYIIYSIRGFINYNNEVEKCLLKLEEISEEISPLFNNAKKNEGRYLSKRDAYGKTYINYVGFTLLSGAEITIQCYDYSKEIKNKNNARDNLSISIETEEAYNWFITPIN